MSTHTEQTPAPAQEQQGTHQFVMVFEQAVGSGHSISGWDGHFTPQPGATRHDALQMLRGEYVRRFPEQAGAVLTFFSLERNAL